MKKILFLLLFFPLWLYAQEDQAYLAGAVPEIDGKVVFQKELSTQNLTSEQIFKAMQTWMHERFDREGCRVVYENPQEGSLAAIGDEYIEFHRSALSLDRSRMLYQVTVECEGQKCLIQFKNIRYKYDVAYQREPEVYDAESWITDKHAIHKGKLNRISGKFRRKTVDFANDLFAGATNALGVNALNGTAQVLPTTDTAAPTATATGSKAGYKTYKTAELPEIMKSMLSSSQFTVEKGGKIVVEKGQAVWKGLGNMFGKDVASFAVPKTTTVTLNNNDTYTLSFFQAGKEEEAWMIIECKMSGTSSEGEQNILMGEVLNVWVK